jgi:hypothetical protein
VAPLDCLEFNEARIQPWRGRSYVTGVLSAAGAWANLVDEQRLPAGVPDQDPYEPIIRFFEQGGGIYAEHGFIDIVPERRGLMTVRVGLKPPECKHE